MSTGLKANPDGSAAIQVGGTDVITLTSGGAATFVTSPTTVQAGTAAAPSITTSGDTNTGIFFPAADTIAFAEGGTEVARFDSVGRMLVGTTTAPSSTDVRVFVNSSGGGFSGFAANGTAGSAVGSPTTSTLAFYTAAGTLGAETYTERARFNSTGAFVFAGGDTSANGTGITFPATQSASSNANTLDDYEEGTWTPVDASGAGLSFTTPEGYYVKIGRQVTAWGYLVYPSTANGSNSVIGGFPFTAANFGSTGSGGMIGYSNESTFVRIYAPTNGTTAVPYTSIGGRITNATFSTDSLYICVTYFV